LNRYIGHDVILGQHPKDDDHQNGDEASLVEPGKFGALISIYGYHYRHRYDLHHIGRTQDVIQEAILPFQQIGEQAAAHRNREKYPHRQGWLDFALPDQPTIPDSDKQADGNHRNDR
jgi:hypothetical protein